MIIVTGGSGLIGRAIIDHLQFMDEKVVSINAQSDVPGVINIQHDLTQPIDHSLLELTEPIEGIIHLAAAHNVLDSVERPWIYYEQNGAMTSNVIGLAVRKRVKWILFASTGMIYESQLTPISVDSDQYDLFAGGLVASNPYAQSKLINESALHHACIAHDITLGVFRIFNVAGPISSLDAHRSRFLIPSILRAIKNQETFIVNASRTKGLDSIVRDYIHVEDVASGFISGMEYMRGSDQLNNWILNLGTGSGTSVLDVISQCQAVSGQDLTLKAGTARNVPDCLIADIDKTQQTLGWQPIYAVKDIIQEQWSIFND